MARALLVALATVTSVTLARGVVPCSDNRARRCCGDGSCDGPEDASNCLADCPGVSECESAAYQCAD